MIQNFTYLAFLCSVCMLLIIGGVLLTNLAVYVQIAMILVGLIGGIICFITLIRLLISHNNQKEQPVPTAKLEATPEKKDNKKRRPQSRF